MGGVRRRALVKEVAGQGYLDFLAQHFSLEPRQPPEEVLPCCQDQVGDRNGAAAGSSVEHSITNVAVARLRSVDGGHVERGRAYRLHESEVDGR